MDLGKSPLTKAFIQYNTYVTRSIKQFKCAPMLFLQLLISVFYVDWKLKNHKVNILTQHFERKLLSLYFIFFYLNKMYLFFSSFNNIKKNLSSQTNNNVISYNSLVTRISLEIRVCLINGERWTPHSWPRAATYWSCLQTNVQSKWQITPTLLSQHLLCSDFP